MVAQDGLAKRGAELLGGRRRLRPQHLVVVALFGPHRIRRRHSSESTAAWADGRLGMLRAMPATPSPGQARAGHLLIIGGAEDKLRQRQILARFVSLAGGADARVVVISTASSLRDEANDPRLVAMLDDATAIFMTGGNQLRLSSVIGGTALGRALAERHRQG